MITYLKKAGKEFIFSNILSIFDVLCTSLYPLILSFIIDNFQKLNKKDIICLLTIFIFSIILLVFIKYINKLVKSKYQKIICQSLRHDAFSNMLSMNYQNYRKESADDYVSFLVNDIDQLYILFFENIIYLSNSIFMLLTYTIVLFLISWQMCLVIMVSLFFIIIVPNIVGKKYDSLNNSVSNSKAKYLSSCGEILEAYDIVENRNIKRFVSRNTYKLDEMQEKIYKLENYKSFIQIFSGSMLYLQLIICFVFGVIFSVLDIISLGILASAMLYVEYVSQYSANIVDEFLEIKSSKVYRERFMTYIENNNQIDCRQILSENFRKLEVNNISFKLGSDYLFKNISLSLTFPQKLLVEGPNGSGKSTFLKILLGLIPSCEGNVLINGHSNWGRKGIGYVPQKRYVFEGTVLDNITLFYENTSSRDLEKIKSLCSSINFNYPLNHFISGNGQNMSGGEIAKICLLRELWTDNKLLLIDEPFNDIDENSINDILDVLSKSEKSIIMISHGLKQKNIFDQFITI